MRSERGFAPLLLVAALALVAVFVLGLIVLIEDREGPAPEPGTGQYEVRAIGDSVTAGWGYYHGGGEISQAKLIFSGRCVPPPTPNGRCQSPAVIAYPAVFAKDLGLSPGPPDFENLAIAGADPVDWLPGGPFSDRLDGVVADDPDLTVLTLGANPLLTQFLFKLEGATCVRRDTEEEIRRCVAAALDDVQVVERLARVYTRLLETPDDGKRGLVVVFQYHETIPSTLRGTRVDILFEMLRGAISTAVERVRQERPGDADRLLLIEPPSFEGHDCHADEPWVLESDFCIHPTAAGHEAYAAALGEAVPDPAS